MKFDVKRTDINGKEISDGHWWSYKLKCDKYNTIEERNGILSSKEPNFNEKDYCIKCISKLIDKYILN